MGWYVARNGKVRGPFAKDALREMVALGEIDSSCRLRSANDPIDNWRPFDEVAEIGALRGNNSTMPPSEVAPPRSPSSLRPQVDVATITIARAEKFGRLLLWIALAVTIVLVPIGLAKERKTEADTLARIKEATRATELKFEALEKSVSDKNLRIPFESIGNGLTSLSVENATGQLWFTNVSPRSGHVCVVGEATNVSTHAVTVSLPACAEVVAYASAVRISLPFPAQQLADNCKTGGCGLHVKDAGASKN